MVGGGELSCPFCGAAVRVSIQRLVGSQAGSGRSRAEGLGGRARHANITFETLAEAALKDKLPASPPRTAIPNAPRAAPERPIIPGFAAAPPPEPPPPPLGGAPRLTWLWSAPERFFRHLELGRPRLPAVAGGLVMACVGAVQGAAFARVWPGALAPAEAAGRAGAAGLLFAGFLLLLYRLGLTRAGAPDDVARRVPRVVGYGLLPAAVGLVPLVGLPVGLALAARAHVAGLARHIGVPRRDAWVLVGLTWACFGLMVWMAR